MKLRQEVLEAALEKAKELATRAKGVKDKYKSYHAAVVVHLPSGRLVAKGTNVCTIKTMRTGYQCLSLHAEMAALRHLNRRLSRNCVMVLTRWTSGGMASSHPCSECEKVLKRWKVTVYYST